MALVGSIVASALSPVPTDIDGIDFVMLTNAVYDEFYADNKLNAYSKAIPSDWDFDTIMHAYFDGDLHAGNVDYYSQEVEFLRIKRRIKGTYDWITLFEVPINDANDFKFERFDKYARSHTEYEYAMVPVIRNIEGGSDLEENHYISEVLSEFDDVFLVERDVSYHSQIEVVWSTAKNRPTVVVAPVNRKYPYVFGNGNQNYYTGSISAIWIELESICDLTRITTWEDAWGMVYKDGWKYRDGLMEFLCNGRPKILKMPDGRMWMVSIIDSPTESITLHNDAPTTSFQWTEVDSCESGMALYENDFIDVDSNSKQEVLACTLLREMTSNY